MWSRRSRRTPGCASAAARALPLRRRLSDKKGLLLDVLSRGFRKRAAALGIATNPAFAGTYDFAAETVPDFAALVSRLSRRAAGAAA